MNSRSRSQTQESNSSESDDEEPRRKVPKLSKQEHIDNYDRLRYQLRNEQSEASKGNASELVIQHLDEIQQLYSRVQTDKNRDTKVHLKDSEAFKETSDFAAMNVRNMKLDDAGVSIGVKEFVGNLKKFMTDTAFVKEDEDRSEVPEDYEDEEELNNGLSTKEDRFNQFNWLKLGVLYLQTSKKVILTDFLNGPLSTERKKIAPRTRNVDDTQSTYSTTAQRVQASEIDHDVEQNTATMVKSVYQTFIKRDESKPVNFFEFFINPDSFSQSVENLFYTSFLIKDARLKLFLDKDGIPNVFRVSDQECSDAKEQLKSIETNHHIATFDYKTWQNLIREFNITTSFLDHRGEVEDTFPEEDMEPEVRAHSRNRSEEENEELEGSRNDTLPDDQLGDQENNIHRSQRQKARDKAAYDRAKMAAITEAASLGEPTPIASPPSFQNQDESDDEVKLEQLDEY
jgi:Uncharacterized conserved protein